MQSYPIWIIKTYKNVKEAEMGLPLIQGAVSAPRWNMIPRGPAGFM